MGSNKLFAASSRFLDWTQHQCLPLWISRGISPTFGGHYERLLANGTPDFQANIRVRVQARQAFSYAYAHRRGWLPQGKTHAEDLFSFIERETKVSSTQGYGHLLNPNFELIDAHFDLYDHAFILLMCAQLHKVNQQKSNLLLAENLTKLLKQTYTSKFGGWLEGSYVAQYRRQNPHMHLFEAFMSLAETSGNSQWITLADEVYELFKTRFYDREHQIVREFFNDDLSFSDTPQGNLVEPGHMMEWAWLLLEYEKLTGKNTGEIPLALYQKASEIGFCTETGLMVDQVDITNLKQSSSKRMWPMTEVIKANIALARAGYTSCEKNAAEAIDLLFTHFIDASTSGLYLDQLGEDNVVLSDIAPASTLYHLVIACGEVADYCASQG